MALTKHEIERRKLASSSSNTADSATAGNQQLAIASLQSLDLDNATEAQQVAVKNAVEAMQAALLADNASEAKQTELIDLVELVRGLVNSVRNAQIETNAALGFTNAATLKARLDEILGDDPALATIQSAIDRLVSAIAPTTKATPSLSIVTASGSVAADTKYIKFTIPPGTAGTIQGQAITPELETVEFPFNAGGYAETVYTLTAGSYIITTVS